MSSTELIGANGQRLCGAKTRRGGQCHAFAMANGRCRVHGGMSLRGEQHPAYKHGRYSKSFVASLPPRFREKFEAAMNDPELLSSRKEAALYSARVVQALERWSEFDAEGYRAKLREAWNSFKDANALPATSDGERELKLSAIGRAVAAIQKLIDDGADEAAAWSDVDAAIRAKLAAAQSEHRRMTDLRQMLTAEQALDIVVALTDILRKRLHDRPDLLVIIGNDIERRFGLAGPASFTIPDASSEDGTASEDIIDASSHVADEA